MGPEGVGAKEGGEDGSHPTGTRPKWSDGAPTPNPTLHPAPWPLKGSGGVGVWGGGTPPPWEGGKGPHTKDPYGALKPKTQKHQANINQLTKKTYHINRNSTKKPARMASVLCCFECSKSHQGGLSQYGYGQIAEKGKLKVLR